LRIDISTNIIYLSASNISNNIIKFFLLYSWNKKNIAFFENILYFYTYLQTHPIDLSVIWFVFLRSIFTVSLHVFGSLLMWKAFLFIFRSLKFFVIQFFLFAFLSVIFHSIFNLSLHYGFVGVVFLYIVFLYITMILLFPSQEEKKSDFAVRI